MVTLALVRHAKSDWGDARVSDHDRPLNARGLRDAPEMASRVRAAGLRPDVIRSSTALRARTTAEAFGAALGVAVDLDEELYGAPADELIGQAAATGAQAVMIVAHDPGMSALAARLSGGEIAHMPTCAVAIFTWDTDDWDVATALDAASFTFDSPRA